VIAANAGLVRLRTQRRNVYALAILLTIAAGLASRRWPWLLPEALGKYPGDALYAVMVYWLVVLVRPRDGTVRSGAVALGICFAIEVLQLWQPPWLQAIRATTIGHLVLGSYFNAPDLLAYAIGVVAAMAIEAWVVARPTATRRPDGKPRSAG
jgi:Protein of unknown function (DUF2809)